MQLVELTQLTHVRKRVDPGVVPVPPLETQGVVADLRKLAQVAVMTWGEPNGARVPLAIGARAVAPQDERRDTVVPTVLPGHLHPRLAHRGFDRRWCDGGCHERIIPTWYAPTTLSHARAARSRPIRARARVSSSPLFAPHYFGKRGS